MANEEVTDSIVKYGVDKFVDEVKDWESADDIARILRKNCADYDLSEVELSAIDSFAADLAKLTSDFRSGTRTFRS